MTGIFTEGSGPALPVRVVQQVSGEVMLEGFKDKRTITFHYQLESGLSSLFVDGFGRQGTTLATIIQNKLEDNGSRTIGLNLVGARGFSGAPGAVGGSIVGMFSFTISKNGAVTLNEDRTLVTEYPSWGVYSYEKRGAQPKVLRETHETNSEALKRAPVPITKVR